MCVLKSHLMLSRMGNAGASKKTFNANTRTIIMKMIIMMMMIHSPVSVVSERKPGRGRGTMCSSMGSVESKDMQLAGDFSPVKRGEER